MPNKDSFISLMDNMYDFNIYGLEKQCYSFDWLLLKGICEITGMVIFWLSSICWIWKYAKLLRIIYAALRSYFINV